MVDFTPGPWQIAKRASRRVTNHHGVVICNAVLRNQGEPKAKKCLKDEHEAEANAALIAAAPELFEALSALLPTLLCGEGWNLPDTEHVSIDVTFGKLKAARAALAKVTA